MGLVLPVNSVGASGIPNANDRPITSQTIATAVKDTFINKTSIAPETYASIYGTLISYTSGVPIVVEYFKKRSNFVTNQAIDTSFSLDRDTVQSSYDLIKNLEIRIDEQLKISIDADTTETSVEGTGILYPGLTPNPGDIFYLSLPDNNVGVFIVNTSVPATISRGTHYKIGFHLYGNLTTDIDGKIRASVVDTLYFNKQNFFNNDVTLLTDTSYNNLKALTRYKAALISQLTNQFYIKSEKTILRPDYVFDMFLVKFLQSKISVNDTRVDICQIPSPFMEKFNQSIWNTLITQDMSDLVLTGYTLVKYRLYYSDVDMSGIDRFKLAFLTSPNSLYGTSGQGQGTFDNGNLLNLMINNSDLIADDERGIASEMNWGDVDTTTTSQRLTQVPFGAGELGTTGVTLKTVNYVFSDRFYYALFHSFEGGTVIPDMTPLIGDIVNDKRIYQNLASTFYSVTDNAYHDMAFFDTLGTVTGSNNDMHIPELEYLLVDFILNDNINTTYLTTNVLSRFPFAAMTPLDRLYTSAFLLHLIDVAIRRLQ